MQYQRAAYPGYFPQSYRIGDHSYSTGGSESQKPPNTVTYGRTPYQWTNEHKAEIGAVATSQSVSQVNRSHAKASVESAMVTTQQAAARTGALLGEVMASTNGLASQLQTSITEVGRELASLQGCMSETQAAIDSKTEPLDAIDKYAALRRERYVSERLVDPLMLNLEKMRTTIQESLRLLESALSAQQSEKVRLQTRQQMLEADLADKNATLAIDTEARFFTPTNRPMTNVAPRPGSAPMKVPQNMHLAHMPYDPVLWKSNSNTLCREAERACQTAARLRATTKKLVNDRQHVERVAFDTLNTSREQSMYAIRNVLATTEAHIAACESEQAALAAQHDVTQQSYQSQQDAFGVVVDRLAWRSGRPTREQVADPAQRALANEVAELKASSRQLDGALHTINQSYNVLAKRIEQLRETVALKTHFLELEERGMEHMATLETLCAGAEAPFAPFHAPAVRPITALPSNRLSMAHVYAQR
jgi:hypothetical protein